MGEEDGRLSSKWGAQVLTIDPVSQYVSYRLQMDTRADSVIAARERLRQLVHCLLARLLLGDGPMIIRPIYGAWPRSASPGPVGDTSYASGRLQRAPACGPTVSAAVSVATGGRSARQQRVLQWKRRLAWPPADRCVPAPP
ncbi:hypothetical protein F503_06400 [Ophiostoma piceae UAMH 11346]|uniref:Uncharacterized protein n=1 Tax=Ophiostoma piceae (strain UAMH 11346) TaxID=1262450 RepID=S3BQX3_OPHP1|nr:hypothetical protein F503_06400 [Ophiostoma piceae UAMH 11346]